MAQNGALETPVYLQFNQSWTSVKEWHTDTASGQACVLGPCQERTWESYESSGDCRPGPESSCTRGMRQLKEALALPHRKQILFGEALRPHGGTVKDLLTAGGQEDTAETEGAATWPGQAENQTTERANTGNLKTTKRKHCNYLGICAKRKKFYTLSKTFPCINKCNVFLKTMFYVAEWKHWI